MLNFLKEEKPEALDSPATTLAHRRILRSKPFLRKIYEEWYRAFISKVPGLPPGEVLEIGSGGGFLKELLPGVIASDILPLPHCDLTLSAEALPFREDSLSAIFMIDVLHHLPECERFFAEASRTLMSGGEIYMIEPANTAWGRLIYQHLHHEPFDPTPLEWRFERGGPLSTGNGALPWMVFTRDIDRFHLRFPMLSLESRTVHTPFRYLLTGGLSYKSMVPGFSFKAFTLLERPFSSLGMFQTIRVRKA